MLHRLGRSLALPTSQTASQDHPEASVRERIVPVTERPGWLSRGRVPCLDGLRAVSIVLVLFTHAGASPGFPAQHSWLTTFARERGLAGDTGVEIFFVISGFLITLLLLRERARTETISL